MELSNFFAKHLKKESAEKQRIKTSLEIYLPGESSIAENPSWNQILQELNRQLAYRENEPDGDYSFLILSFEPPYHTIQYIQMSCRAGEESFPIEVRLTDGPQAFKHYHLNSTSPKELFRAFEEVVHGRIPDLRGWEDWTDKM